MHKYSRIYRAMCAMPWMIQPEKLEAIAEFMMFQMEGGKLNREEVEAATAHPKRGATREMQYFAIEATEMVDDQGSVVGQNKQAGPKGQVAGSKGNVAVIPIYGVIAHRASMDISSGGGFNIESFRQQFRQAL
jgi:hypothetical protein